MTTIKRDGKRDTKEKRGSSPSAASSSGSQKSKRRKEGDNKEKDGGGVIRTSVSSSVDKYRNIVPTPSGFEKPLENEIIDLNKIDHLPSQIVPIEVGSWVFAKYDDDDRKAKKLYSAVIDSETKLNINWKVRFDDEDVRKKWVVSQDFILPLKIVGVDSPCFVIHNPNSTNVAEGTVIGQKYEETPVGGIVKYAVEWKAMGKEKKTSFCVRHQLVFDLEQVKIITDTLEASSQPLPCPAVKISSSSGKKNRSKETRSEKKLQTGKKVLDESSGRTKREENDGNVRSPVGGDQGEDDDDDHHHDFNTDHNNNRVKGSSFRDDKNGNDEEGKMKKRNEKG